MEKTVFQPVNCIIFITGKYGPQVFLLPAGLRVRVACCSAPGLWFNRQTVASPGEGCMLLRSGIVVQPADCCQPG
jgi:hypothetical protein